ncbi:hypothetical protein N7471_006287 [Penicillium samsonianum]|uniref:uncharacterized protein n=1 Tax=Penicillium samsonianum TaxID=1882272 RepID=UPI00254681AE|nr:uncharacterized protein N7471_006287 [Penicillium samsonianum]KAJ6139801.1 hypothetical protein N7471_006287 [Penicillium samsonianum]
MLLHREESAGPDLLYHDRIDFDANGDFVPLPAEVRLSDANFFLIVASNNPTMRVRNAKWLVDFNTDVYPEIWPRVDPVLVRLLNLPAYHIECADSTTNSKVYTVPASFFQKHSIQIDYDQAKAVQYQNNLDPTNVEVKAVEVKSSPR